METSLNIVILETLTYKCVKTVSSEEHLKTPLSSRNFFVARYIESSKLNWEKKHLFFIASVVKIKIIPKALKIKCNKQNNFSDVWSNGKIKK